MADETAGQSSANIDGFEFESSSTMTPGQTSEQLADQVRSIMQEAGAIEVPPDMVTGDPESDAPPAPADPPTPEADPADAPPVETKPADPPTEASKPKGRVAELRARIAAATREKHEAENERAAIRAELDRERQELERIRAEKAALASPPAAPATPPAAPKPDDTTPASDPMPSWATYQEQDKDWASYERDLAAWNERRDARIEAKIAEAAATREKAARAAEDERRHAQMEAETDRRHQERVKKLFESDTEFAALAESPDFRDMPLSPFMKAVVKLHDRGPDVMKHLAKHPEDGYALHLVEWSRPMMDAVRTADNPVHLLSYLANNEGEAKRIARLSPAAQLRALVSIDLQQQQPGAKNGSPAAAEPVASPPLPARVGGTRSVAAARDVSELTTSDDDALEYVRRMNQAEGLPV